VAGLMLNGVAVQAVFSVLIAAGAWIAVGGDINPITLVAILGLAARFASPLSALSGGERQRVSIARALVKNAPIVLFDEATSALDPENEHHVAESIRTLGQSSTVIVIAHKLSTVTAADNIVVLAGDGTVEDQGTHAQLMERGGQYAQFWTQRVAAAGWTMAASDVACIYTGRERSGSPRSHPDVGMFGCAELG